MPDKMKKYWFYLSKDVFISFDKQHRMLLYSTKSGNYLISSGILCVELVKEVYDPKNLGVVELNTKYLTNNESNDFIEEIQRLKLGDKMVKIPDQPKPINLLPILNLQNDVEKLLINGEQFLIGEGISEYLTCINIYINSNCSQKCRLCHHYYLQTRSCSKSEPDVTLPLMTIGQILSQASVTQTRHINILGGNILLYPEWNELMQLFKSSNFEYHLWINYQNINSTEKLKHLPFQKELLITFPFKEAMVCELISLCETDNNITLNFLIEDISQLVTVNKLLAGNSRIRANIIPIFNGENRGFFEQNVFLNLEDILAEKQEMRNIFCNQKLNANYFGGLNILADGSVKASMNTTPVGRFPKNSLLELVYNELIQNTAWRKVRDNETCRGCLFQYLCPPPGNYEHSLGKPDMCNVES
ncbi:MAG TPA: hypothetical protein DEO70_14175 [Bacteroidales bacterium]|nr:MAG: hypothetical protein A2X11_13500 [Bacteroidetes bacterium GWE2_42_24]OFY26717.1 MAG: hypothetical protein A2X09_09930 [Bacteroidetes bacterium GWF2_43_11]HBZ67977.1 hypothetical protein [Bacteroidales bacterium]